MSGISKKNFSIIGIDLGTTYSCVAVYQNGKVEIKNAKTGEVTEATVDKKTGEYVAVLTVPDPNRNKTEERKVTLKVEGKEVEADFGSHVEKINGKEQILKPGEKKDSIKGVEVVVPVDHKKVVQNGEEKIVKYFGLTDEWATIKVKAQQKGYISDSASSYFILLLTVKYQSKKDNIWMSFYEGLHRHAALLLSLTSSSFNLTKNEIKFKSLTSEFFSQHQIENFEQNNG